MERGRVTDLVAPAVKKEIGNGEKQSEENAVG